MPVSAEKKRARKIVNLLKKEYPGSSCTLDFKTPHQLLVATILSAQCTDERVNIVTRKLFEKYKRPKDYADAPISELEEDIRSTGFYRNKAAAIRKSSQMIANDYGGKVPDRMNDLVGLPGVGRKTATVILGTAFGKAEGITVDTHVMRLSSRLGFTEEKGPEKIERELMNLISRKDWIIFSHLLIDHGRAVCKARRPDCPNCVLAGDCPSFGDF